MNRIVQYCIIALCALAASKSFGQRSCVFLGEEKKVMQEENDRPKGIFRHNHTPSILQTPIIPNAAPDFPNIDVDSNYLGDQDEPSIAINPTDPNNIIIGSNDYLNDSSLTSYSSRDGGITWKSKRMPANWTFAANATDPAIAFNSSGEAFYSYGRWANDPFNFPRNDIVCNSSSDSGKSWHLPVRVIYNNDSTAFDRAQVLADKYYLAIDNTPSSAFRGRIYVSWVEFDETVSDRVRCSYSSDNGQHWSVPVYITSSGHYESPIPVVAPDGSLYIAYEDLDTAKRHILLAYSGDGGVSFIVPGNVISSYSELGPYYPAGDIHGHPIIKGGLRVNSFPTIAVDYSEAHHGRIYLAWTGMGNDNRNHIYLTLSDDIGNHWTTPKPIENDPWPIATDKFFPWIAVDDSTGDVGIACYDSREDTTNVLTDLYMFFSGDGGQSFTPERISGESSDIRANSSLDTSGDHGPKFFFGDYIGVAVHNKIWYPAWTDSRVGYDQEIFTSIVRPYAPSAPRNFAAVENGMSHFPDLSWDYSGLTTFGMPLVTGNNFIFRLKRLDGVFSIDLPSTARSFTDSQAVINKNHTYMLQVITSDNDTSSIVTAFFTPASSVFPAKTMSSLHAELSENPVRIGSSPEIKLFVDEPATITINIYSIIGKKQETLALNKFISAGENDFEFSPKQSGCYFYEIIAHTSQGDQRSYGKFVVMP